MDEETQLLLSFTFDGRQLTWRRMPQGYIDSLAVYSMALRASLQGWSLLNSSVLLRYVNGILFCSPSREVCRKDSRYLLEYLCNEGHKVAKQKKQNCQESVQYLVFTLTKGTCKVSQSRIQAILGLPCPASKKDMLSFLGMINICRQWITDCSYYDHILRAATNAAAPN